MKKRTLFGLSIPLVLQQLQGLLEMLQVFLHRSADDKHTIHEDYHPSLIGRPREVVITLPLRFGRGIHQAEGLTSVLKPACANMQRSLTLSMCDNEDLQKSICEIKSQIYT